MVAVSGQQHLGRHAQKARRLPHRHAALHEPGRRRVAQGMWRNPAAKLGQLHRALEALLGRRDGLAVEFDEAFGNQFQPSPAAHVGQ